MKRLITLSGPGGRAVLTLGEEIKLSVPAKELYLADRHGAVYPPESPPQDIIGAFVTENGRIVMQGCLAGYSAALYRAKTALLMGLAAKEKPVPSTPQKPSAPSPEHQPRSAQLMEILQKAAELFPPEPPSPPPQPSANDAIANPFPKEFPFSRWRRVEYPGTDRCYLEGEARHRGVDYVIHALPAHGQNGGPQGYNRFLRARDGSGFWVRVRRK